MHEHARVASVAQHVINESRVPPHRRSQPRSPEVRLGRNRVLLIAQMIGDIRKQFDERDAEVCGGALAPAGDEERNTIQHQPPERAVVAREIVDARRRLRRLRTGHRGAAIEIGFALDLERELHRGQRRIDVLEHVVAERRLHQLQRVWREIAACFDFDHEHVAVVHRVLHDDVANALAACDANDVFQFEAERRGGRRRTDEVDSKKALAVREQRLVVIDDFEEVDAVQLLLARRVLLRAQQVAALVVATDEHAGARGRRHACPSRENCAVRCCCVRMTT